MKPDNVLMMADKTPRLADFGLSSYADPVRSSPADRNRRCGTRKYFPPEYANKDQRIEDPRPADVYEIGVTLRQVLTGVDPSLVDSNDLSASRILMENRKLGEGLKHLVLRMIHPDVAQRCTIERCIRSPWFDEVREEVDQETELAMQESEKRVNTMAKVKGGVQRSLKPTALPQAQPLEEKDPLQQVLAKRQQEAQKRLQPHQDKTDQTSKRKHRGFFDRILHPIRHHDDGNLVRFE